MSQVSFNLRYLLIDQYDTYIVHLMAFSDQMVIIYHKKAACQLQSLSTVIDWYRPILDLDKNKTFWIPLLYIYLALSTCDRL